MQNKWIRLGLRPEEYDQLTRIAEAETRIPDQQALHILRRALADQQPASRRQGAVTAPE